MKKYLGTIMLTLLGLPVIAGATLWSYYQDQGLELPSVVERVEIASSYGIEPYEGSYSQNEALESSLRGQSFEEPILGGSSLIAGSTYTLSGSGITSSATSLTLASFTIPQNGYLIQDSDLSDIFYLTLEPGNKRRQEIISCTTVTQNANNATLSGCVRGLSPLTPFTASSTLQFTHGGSSQVILSDPPQVFNEFANRFNADLILGTWTFDNFPVASSTIGTPTTSKQFATKEYADNIANQGAATSTEAIGGISKLATRVENASSTAATADEPLVQQSQHSTSTPSANILDNDGLWDVWSENDGKLSQVWLDLTEAWTFTGNFQSASTTIGTRLLVTGNATTTGQLEIGGPATSTVPFDTAELCFDGTDCVTNQFVGNYYATSSELIIATTAADGVYQRVTATTTILNITAGDVIETTFFYDIGPDTGSNSKPIFAVLFDNEFNNKDESVPAITNEVYQTSKLHTRIDNKQIIFDYLNTSGTETFDIASTTMDTSDGLAIALYLKNDGSSTNISDVNFHNFTIELKRNFSTTTN